MLTSKCILSIEFNFSVWNNINSFGPVKSNVVSKNCLLNIHQSPLKCGVLRKSQKHWEIEHRVKWPVVCKNIFKNCTQLVCQCLGASQEMSDLTLAHGKIECISIWHVRPHFSHQTMYRSI